MCRDVTMRSVVGNKYEVLHLSPSKNLTILPVSARQMSIKKGRPSAEESKFRLEDTATGLRSYYKIHGHYNVPAGSHFVQFGGREAFDLGKQLAVYRRTSPESTQRQGETFVFCLQVVCVVKQQHWIDFRCMHTVTCN